MSLPYSTRLISSHIPTISRLSQITSHLRPLTRFQTRSMASASTIPKTMKGVLVEKTGGVEVLQYKTDLPVPVPKEGEVLVKNEFIGVNFIDTYFRTGLYPCALPTILGREAEGEIISLGSSGEMYNLTVGSRVVFIGTGSYAEYTCAPANKTHILPEGLKPGVAAASILQGLTALTFIREAYEVKKGDWVLVHAAAGGVGLWLCQLLRAVGARVIGTASTPEKISLAHQNGAEYTINYQTEPNLVAKVKEITGGEGVAVVYDGIGKDQFDNDLELVARKGSVVSFGNASGPVPPLSIARLGAKNIKLLRPVVNNYIFTRQEFESYTSELFQFIVRDEMDVRVHDTYPLSEVKKAHSDLEGRVTMGKVLLRP